MTRGESFVLRLASEAAPCKREGLAAFYRVVTLWRRSCCGGNGYAADALLAMSPCIWSAHEHSDDRGSVSSCFGGLIAEYGPGTSTGSSAERVSNGLQSSEQTPTNLLARLSY